MPDVAAAAAVPIASSALAAPLASSSRSVSTAPFASIAEQDDEIPELVVDTSVDAVAVAEQQASLAAAAPAPVDEGDGAAKIAALLDF